MAPLTQALCVWISRREAYRSAPMLHMRIVVPSDRGEHVLATLERTPAVFNIVRLRDVARRPDGDMILCDVPREAASIVVSDLDQLGVPADGSIAIEKVDTEISRVGDLAERRAPGDPSNAVVWEEVEELTSEQTDLSITFLLFMALATIIASIGIYLNTPILIIGAMVIGPEFGPISAACVAAVQQRPRLALRSLLALAVGFPVGIGMTYVASLLFKWTGLTPDDFSEASHSLSNVISSPDFFSFFVAFCAGVAGMLSLTTAKSGALTGVLISVTTIPSAANVAVAGAYADWPSLRGSLEQLGINIGSIFLAGILTLYVQRRIFARRRREHLRALGS
jgi:uncharacterized hydrophobic protein (TIGR00271 family)